MRNLHWASLEYTGGAKWIGLTIPVNSDIFVNNKNERKRKKSEIQLNHRRKQKNWKQYLDSTIFKTNLTYSYNSEQLQRSSGKQKFGPAKGRG